MRDLVLRDYQKEPVEYVLTKKRSILAIAPNGGKTEISIAIIEKYLEENPTHKVLVLTHSTNVLLDNFFNRIEEINVGFTYSRIYEPNASVHISLPHNEKRLLAHYDFIIVDEAHENYLANRVQRILANATPIKELLLTGTPSKFIYEGGYDIYPLACNEIPEEYFAKLNIELVASSYKWTANDYNKDGDIKRNFNFGIDDTNETLILVMDAIINRIKQGVNPKQYNNPNWFLKLKTWLGLFNHIGKTLIACKSINQANDVYDMLKKKGIDVGLSTSDEDKDSLEVEKFKNDGYNVLVVVNRARLGYSDDNLMNIIDMTGTHNPDIIFQMFCRALRGTPDVQKLYLKVTPKKLDDMAITHFSMCAALMLTDKKFLETYNGRKFNDIRIPVLKNPPKEPIVQGERGGNRLPRTPKGNVMMLPQFTHDVIDTMKNVQLDLDGTATIYKYVTIREVKQELGYSKRNVLTLRDILKSAAGNMVNENDYSHV